MSKGKWQMTRFYTGEAKSIAENIPGLTVFELATELQKIRAISRKTAIRIAYRTRAVYPQLDIR